MEGNNDTEQKLIERWRGGDQKAFDRLFTLHFHKLYQFALRHTRDAALSEELVMDMMVKVWQKKSELQQNQTLSFFLFHALKMALIDHYRRKRIECIALEEIVQEPACRESADHHLQSIQLESLFKESLTRLSSQRRQVFEMKAVKGMSYQEIADALKISPNTVNRHLVDAVSSIKNYLRHHTDIVFAIIYLLLA